LLILFAVGLVGGIAYAFMPRPLPVDMASVERGPLRVTINEDGRTRIKEKYIVSSPLSGRLRRIQLRAGDEVVAGETLLAVVEPTHPELLDARARAEAQARVNAAEAALERAEPALQSAEAAMEFAESELARVRRLFERNGAAQQQLDAAELAYRQRTQDYRTAKFNEEIARYELEMSRAALLRTQPQESPGADAEWQFRILAPITGSVLRVFQESETIVMPGTQLLELGDPRDLEVEVDVLSSDAVRISPGNDVLLEQWGGERPLKGAVRLVEPSAFTKISALGVEEQRVYVIIDLLDPPEERPSLGDAYRVEARIITWQQDDVLKIPTSALFRHDDEWAVFRVVDGRARLQPVLIGQRNALEAQVLGGLKEGDIVIVHPSDKLAPGTAVVAR
jgi:HlyD family secretion protein